MAITITCPCCSAKLKYDPPRAGKRGRCPACGKTFRIPGPSVPAPGEGTHVQSEEAPEGPTTSAPPSPGGSGMLAPLSEGKRAVIAALAETLRRRPWEDGYWVLEELAGFGPDAHEAIPLLTSMVRGEHPAGDQSLDRVPYHERRQVGGGLGLPVDAHGNRGLMRLALRVRAGVTLARLGAESWPPDLVAGVLQALGAGVPDSEKRCWVEAVGHIGPAAAAAAPLLHRISQAHRLSSLGNAADESLCRVAGPGADPPPDPAAERAAQEEERQRQERVKFSYLKEFAENTGKDFASTVLYFRELEFRSAIASTAIPVLLARMDDPNVEVRAWAACLLADLGAGDRFLPFLIEITEQGLRDYDACSNSALAQAAIEAIGRMGPAATSAVPALTAALSKHWLCLPAAEALWRVGEVDPAIPALAEIVARKGGSNRGKALRLLGVIGPQAAAAVPTLIRVLEENTLSSSGQDGDSFNDGVIIETLGRIGPAAAAAVPILLKPPAKPGASWPKYTVRMALLRIDPSAVAKSLLDRLADLAERENYRPAAERPRHKRPR